ncbi:metallophosphoesterase [Bradyrhizobium erythrophlei]|nr:metallophosphoesterase [Bradyrhizobium erythrophlei]
MTKTHLIIPDSHAHPDHNNDRADWLGQLIADVKPDALIHIGDSADMASLSLYDKGKHSFHGRNYKADISAHCDFQDRTFAPIKKAKRKLPTSYFFVGNHEHRITRAIDVAPELDGAISMKDLQLKEYYDEVIDYTGSTPGVRQIDGISYAHYFVGGIAGRPLGGIHAGYAIATKKHSSATCGHSHLVDWSVHTNITGQQVAGMVVGCYQDYTNDWAGNELGKLWWRGVVVKRNVDGNGGYDPQFITLDALRKEYAVV